MSTVFNTLRTTEPEAKAKLKLVMELTFFVQQGLARTHNSIATRKLLAASNAIQAELAHSILGPVGTTIKKPVDIRKLVLNAYLNALDDYSKFFFGELIAPVAITPWVEEVAILRERYGDAVEVSVITPTLDSALTVAWLNVRRAQQRWLSAKCLNDMLANVSHGHATANDINVSFDHVMNMLFTNIHRMEQRLLMLSLLKGGEDSEKVKQWLIKTKLNESMSVMELLSIDGMLPNGWITNDEQLFRKSLVG